MNLQPECKHTSVSVCQQFKKKNKLKSVDQNNKTTKSATTDKINVYIHTSHTYSHSPAFDWHICYVDQPTNHPANLLNSSIHTHNHPIRLIVSQKKIENRSKASRQSRIDRTASSRYYYYHYYYNYNNNNNHYHLCFDCYSSCIFFSICIMRMFKSKNVKHKAKARKKCSVEHNLKKKNVKIELNFNNKSSSCTSPQTHTQTPNTTSINHVADFVVCLFFHLFNFYTIKKINYNQNRTKKNSMQNEKKRSNKIMNHQPTFVILLVFILFFILNSFSPHFTQINRFFFDVSY